MKGVVVVVVVVVDKGRRVVVGGGGLEWIMASGLGGWCVGGWCGWARRDCVWVGLTWVMSSNVFFFKVRFFSYLVNVSKWLVFLLFIFLPYLLFY